MLNLRKTEVVALKIKQNSILMIYRQKCLVEPGSKILDMQLPQPLLGINRNVAYCWICHCKRNTEPLKKTDMEN